MTNTQIPNWHTTGPDTAIGRIDKLTAALSELRVKYAQAADAQRVADAAQRKAEERAQEERDRADGAEAWGRALAIKHEIGTACQDTGIDPDRLDTSALDSLAEGLHEDWKTGTDVDDLDPVRHLRDWEADQ